MNIEDRIKYYLGDLKEEYKKNFHKYVKKYGCDKVNIIELFKEENIYQNNKKYIYRNYYLHLKNLLLILKNSNYNFKCQNIHFMYGDYNKNEEDILYICKTRVKSSKNIILNLNFNRHWDLYYKLLKKGDIKFINKNDKIIWRGSTTGIEKSLGNRFNLVKKYFYHYNRCKFIDIAFSKNSKINSRDIVGITKGKEKYMKLVRQSYSMEELLSSKFLICIEGNDVASGLKWMLLSNSVVIMPRPKISSWLMEFNLIPWVHYVPLSDDFHDVLIMYKWCLKNFKKCELIAKKSTEYMLQFSDINKEKEIEIEVLKRYLEFIE